MAELHNGDEDPCKDYLDELDDKDAIIEEMKHILDYMVETKDLPNGRNMQEAIHDLRAKINGIR